MPSREAEKYCCPRCSRGLRAESSAMAADADSDRGAAGSAGGLSGPPIDDGWELDQQLEHIERVLSAAKVGGRQSPPAERQEVVRLDPAHPVPAAYHLPLAGKSARGKTRDSRESSAALAVLTWTILSLGTTAFVCGGMLLGWSFVANRQELWNLGLPIALGGQIALLIGLVLQLDRLWSDSRHAAAKLDDVDQQLHELKTATTLLGTSHSSPASAFYSHMAYGASPQLLLADLKSQLDLLAVKIGQGE